MESNCAKSNQRPLQIPKILHHIFTFLSVEDLKASRLVCRIWHVEATPSLSSRIHPILLHEKIEWKKFLKLFSKSVSSPKMSKMSNIHPFHSFSFYSAFPEDPSATPYKTAILDYMHSKYKLPRKTLWDTKFFTTYGSQITTLTFIQFNLYTEKALREFREMLSSLVPNLKELTLEFQKSSNSSDSTSTSSNTPTPSPSPSPGIPGGENVFFFPPNESSQRKTLSSLERFTFATDNKCYMNPHALEEFMALMPSLKEFTYRYTGAKKQWTLVRRVDIINILCNIINAGHYNNLEKLDLDSNGTVLSGEDFNKIRKLRQRLHLKDFLCQVFVKIEQDWEYLCNFLEKIQPWVKFLDLQVRTHFPQLLYGHELPHCFPRVEKAKLLLDSNLKTFLRRMPLLKSFTGVYDNELLPLNDSSFNPVGYDDFSSSTSQSQQAQTQTAQTSTNFPEKVQELGLVGLLIQDYDDEGPSCPSAVVLKIEGNDEFGLDIEWKHRVFPNISTFETDIYFEEDLRLIWIHLKRIKRLVLHLKTAVQEQAFIGPEVPILNSHHFKICSSAVHNMEDFHTEQYLVKMEDYPHLGLLKNLEAFEICTGSRQDAYGSDFSASLIIFGVSLLPKLRRLVLPPSIPPKCLEESLRYLSLLNDLRYLSVCDDTFKSVLPFHILKEDLPELEIIVRYYQPEIKRKIGNYWKLERFQFPDFLPEQRKVMNKRNSAPS